MINEIKCTRWTKLKFYPNANEACVCAFATRHGERARSLMKNHFKTEILLESKSEVFKLFFFFFEHENENTEHKIEPLR